MTNAEKNQVKPSPMQDFRQTKVLMKSTAEVVPSLVVNRVWFWSIMMHYVHCARILMSHFTVRFCCLVAKLSFTTHHTSIDLQEAEFSVTLKSRCLDRRRTIRGTKLWYILDTIREIEFLSESLLDVFVWNQVYELTRLFRIRSQSCRVLLLCLCAT